MRINFVLRSLNHQRGHFDLLTRIVGTIVDDWHEWYGPSPDDNRFVEYFENNPQHQELAEKSYARSRAYGDQRRSIVSVSDFRGVVRPETNVYSLDKALDYLGQPLRVLVENEISDGHFYLSYLRAIDPDLAAIFSSSRPPIVFENGGGNMEIVKLVEHRVARSGEHSLRPRLVVLADSDSQYPGHLPMETNKLVQICQRLGVAVHVTRKRAQENYLADTVFMEAAQMFNGLREPVNFLVGLSSVQRDHYPIKKGLASSLSDGERKLYVGLPIVEPGSSRMKVTRIAEFFREKYSRSIELYDLNERACDAEFRAIAELLRREI